MNRLVKNTGIKTIAILLIINVFLDWSRKVLVGNWRG